MLLKHNFNVNTNRYKWKCVFCEKTVDELLIKSNCRNEFIDFIITTININKFQPAITESIKWINNNCIPCLTEEEHIIKNIIE